MADAWRRYVAQQAELGGDEVLLSGPLVPRAPAAVEGTPAAVAEPSPAGQAEMVGEEPKWKRGAPPIPGPGISRTLPRRDGTDLLASLPTLDAVAEFIRGQHCCGLCAERTNAVPGEGNPRARLMLVGEGPGETEDATGRPFVGAAGKLLDQILQSIDCPRETVFIANVVKCRPPKNRKPLPDEMAACLPFLYRQIELVAPAVLLALGSTAAEALLDAKKPLGELRGKVHSLQGIPLVVTYHPAALLRNPNWKKPTWDDVRIARQLLER